MQRANILPRGEERSRSMGDALTWLGNGLAALLSAIAIAAGAVGMLVAFSVVGNAADPFEDGLMWLIGGVVMALAANVFRREHHIARATSLREAPATEARDAAEDRRARGGARTARDLRDLAGMTVVTTDEARDVGTVREVLFDPHEMAVLALVVAPSGMKDGRMFVEREYVRGFGRDAVTIQSESTMRAFATEGREREFADGGVRLVDVRVMTERGDDVGKLRKLLVSDDCRIVALEAGGGLFGRRRRFDGGDIVSMGRGRMIVSSR